MNEEEKRFIKKEMKLQNLDSLLLFTASILGFFFSYLYIFYEYVEVALAFIPVIILGLVVPVYVGYVRGAILLDNLEERVRGWIYFTVGVIVYIIYGIMSFFGKGLKYLPPLKNLPPLYGNLLSGVVFSLGPFFLAFFMGKATSDQWISNSIFKAFDEEITKITQKIFDDTWDSAFFAAILLSISFMIEDILFMIILGALGLIFMLWGEKDIRKFIKINQYSRFLNVEKQWTKPRISSVFGKIGILFMLSGVFLGAGILPNFQETLLIILSSICLAVFFIGMLLIFLSRKRYFLRFKRKKMKIPKEVEKELATLLGDEPTS